MNLGAGWNALYPYAPPFGAALTGGGVAEHSANGMPVATIRGYGLSAEAALSYSLRHGAVGSFATDAATGEVTVHGAGLVGARNAFSRQARFSTATARPTSCSRTTPPAEQLWQMSGAATWRIRRRRNSPRAGSSRMNRTATMALPAAHRVEFRGQPRVSRGIRVPQKPAARTSQDCIVPEAVFTWRIDVRLAGRGADAYL